MKSLFKTCGKVADLHFLHWMKKSSKLFEIKIINMRRKFNLFLLSLEIFRQVSDVLIKWTVFNDFLKTFFKIISDSLLWMKASLLKLRFECVVEVIFLNNKLLFCFQNDKDTCSQLTARYEKCLIRAKYFHFLSSSVTFLCWSRCAALTPICSILSQQL